MRLFILALKDVADEIGDVFIDAENTGIGSVLANKVCMLGDIVLYLLLLLLLLLLLCHLCVCII